MIIYFIQVCAGIAAWWLLYRLFFRAKAAAKTNRLFLLCGLLLPFFLPLIPLSNDVVSTASPILLPAISITAQDVISQSSQSATNWLFLIYVVGLIAMLLYQLSGMFMFLKLKRSSRQESSNPIIYRFSNSFMPFSFFGTIFLPQELPQEQEALIVAHEKWHIKLLHSWDVLLGALVRAVLWFFPLIPIYMRDLRTEHEFEVDEKMLGSTTFTTYAETLLQVSLMPIPHAQFNTFSAPTLKKRITMMTITQKQNTWKLILFLPLIASMVYLNACSKQVEESVTQSTSPMQMGDVDAPPQFTDCATDVSFEAQQKCFTSGIVGLITANMKYPEIAKEWGATGKVFVSFIINEKGEFVNAQITRGIQVQPDDENGQQISDAFNSAAIAVFAGAPKLIPAQKDGKAVAVEFVVPINFALPPAEEPKK